MAFFELKTYFKKFSWVIFVPQSKLYEKLGQKGLQMGLIGAGFQSPPPLMSIPESPYGRVKITKCECHHSLYQKFLKCFDRQRVFKRVSYSGACVALNKLNHLFYRFEHSIILSDHFCIQHAYDLLISDTAVAGLRALGL